MFFFESKCPSNLDIVPTLLSSSSTKISLSLRNFFWDESMSLKLFALSLLLILFLVNEKEKKLIRPLWKKIGLIIGKLNFEVILGVIKEFIFLNTFYIIKINL